MKRITVVLASDENYAAPTYVTLYSMLKSSAPDTNYDVYFLCPDNISEHAVHILKLLETEFGNCSIEIMNMGNRFSDLKMKISHISSPTFYRLCLPELLPQVDKCIYLDSDIVVNQDLSDLYHTDMCGYYVAGVLSEGIQTDKYYQKALCKRIGLKDVSTYINAGVLLMNLDLLRQDGIMENWLALTKREFPAQDQDIINLSCWGKIKLLPLKYNTMTKCQAIKGKEIEAVEGVYQRGEIEEARTNPVIIHYADRIKPWNDKESIYAAYWWNIVDRLSDNACKEYVLNFVGNCKFPKESIKQKAKRVMIRGLQIIGVYVFLKRIEDKIMQK